MKTLILPQRAHAQTVGTKTAVHTAATMPTVPGKISQEKLDLQDAIESYIRRIFIEDPDTAVAISRAECSPRSALYPKCDKTISNVEYSVGVFQVNLKSKEALVHFNQVPGTTLDDKVRWLSDPWNNVVFAHWVYATSGWEPWSTYTSGAYLANL